MADLETLTLRITQESSKAFTAIKNLAQKLDALSVAVAKLEVGRLNDLSAGLINLNAAINVVKNNTRQSDFTRLFRELSTLGNVDNAKLDSISASLMNLSNSFAGLSNTAAVATGVRDLVSSVSKLGGVAIERAVVNIPQLEQSLGHLITSFSQLPNVNQSVIDFTNSLANLASQGQKVGSAGTSVANSLERYSASAQRATRHSHSLASTIGTLYAKFWLFMRGATALKNSFVSAAEYLEAFNYFDVTARKIGKDTFRRAGVGTAEEYADAFTTTLREKLKKMSGLELDLEDRLIKTTNAKSLGLNITELTQYQAAIASLTNSMGVTQGVAEASAKALSMLAGDMASLRNMEFDEVASKLQSGLTGMARSLYAFGIDITNATLEEYAYANGIEKAVSEMSQSEKAQLRLLAILDQSKVAWGDLANTINSPSNQLRMLKTNLKETGTVFGQLFIPIMSSALPVINGLAMAIKQLMVEIAELLGVKLDLESFGEFGGEITEDIEGMEELNKAVEKTKKGIREFDELKVISTGKGSASGVGDQIDLTQEIINATAEYEKVWDEAYERMTSKASEIAGYISQAFAPLKKIIEDFHIGDFFTAGEDVSALVISIFDFFTDAIKEVDWEALGVKVGEFFTGIDWVGVFKSIGGLIWSAIQGAIDGWTGAFSVAPFETAILTAFGLLKFGGLGGILKEKLASRIAKWMKKEKITQADLQKFGMGVASIGIGIAFSIDNISEIKDGKYKANDVQSAIKSLVSALFTGAGFALLASAIGIASGGLAFGIGAAISLIANLVIADAVEPPPLEQAEKVKAEEYKWVEEHELDTLEVITNLKVTKGNVDVEFGAIEELANKVYDLSASYDDLTDGEKGLLKYYSDELIKVMPELADKIDEVTGAYKGSRLELDQLLAKQREQMYLNAYQGSMTELIEQEVILKKDINALEEDKKAAEDFLAKYLDLSTPTNDSEYRTWQYYKDVFGYNEAYAKQIPQYIVDQVKAGEKEVELYNKKTEKWVKIDLTKIANALATISEAEADLSKTNANLKKVSEEYDYWEQQYLAAINGTADATKDAAKSAISGAESEIKSPRLPQAMKDTLDKVDKTIADGGAVSEKDMNDLFDNINTSFAGLDDGEVPKEVQRTMDNIKYAIQTNSPALISYMALLRKQMENAFTGGDYDKFGNLIWNPNQISRRLGTDIGKITESVQYGNGNYNKTALGQLGSDIAELFGNEVPAEVTSAYNTLAKSINGGDASKTVFGALDDFKRTLVDKCKEIGLNVDLSLGYSIDQNGHFVYEATDALGVYSGEGMMHGIEAKSPSKLFRRIGAYIPEGAALGIEDETPDAVLAIDNMIAQMRAAFVGVKYNIPSLDFLGSNSSGSFDYGKMDSNNAFMSQMSGVASQMAQNGQTEVVFRIEGDPYGMFKIVREENDKYKRMHSNRSAFT